MLSAALPPNQPWAAVAPPSCTVGASPECPVIPRPCPGLQIDWFDAKRWHRWTSLGGPYQRLGGRSVPRRGTTNSPWMVIPVSNQAALGSTLGWGGREHPRKATTSPIADRWRCCPLLPLGPRCAPSLAMMVVRVRQWHQEDMANLYSWRRSPTARPQLAIREDRGRSKQPTRGACLPRLRGWGRWHNASDYQTHNVLHQVWLCRCHVGSACRRGDGAAEWSLAGLGWVTYSSGPKWSSMPSYFRF
jgi:hypothetical protein